MGRHLSRVGDDLQRDVRILKTRQILFSTLYFYIYFFGMSMRTHLLSSFSSFLFFFFCNYLFSESIYARVENKKLLCDAKCYRGIPHSAAICRTTVFSFTAHS